MNKTISVAYSLILAAASMQSYALNFEQKDTTVIISGNASDILDRSKLVDFIKKGATTLVFRNIGGGSMDVDYRIGRAIKKAGVTTVIDGYCSGLCPMFFMAGKTRLLARSADPKNPSAMILQRAVTSETSSAARSTAQYAYYADLFGKGMPSATLNRYTINVVVNEYLYFSAPSPQHREGALFDCTKVKSDDGKSSNKCNRVEGLTALGVGQITSVEPFEIPGREPIGPKYKITSENLGSITLAKEYSKENGAQGVGTTFNTEGKIFAITSLAWQPNKDLGRYEYSAKWYKNGKLFMTSEPEQMFLNGSSARFWYKYDTLLFGPGNFKVEIYLEGELLGSKSFSIAEK